MKLLTKFYLAAVLFGGFAGAVLPVRAQNPATPAVDSAGYADGVVATVGKRKITRRDVVVTYAAYNPNVLGAALWERYPALDDSLTLTMESLCRSAFASGTAQFDNVVELLLVSNALEEAAAQRGIKISPDEVDAQTHRSLETRRKAGQLAEASDEEIARKLNDNLFLLRRTSRETLLRKALQMSDLNARLGHPLGIEDCYSVHALFTRVDDANGVLDAKATLDKIQRQKADILAKKQTFEAMAKAESRGESKGRGGDFGPLTRKLLKDEIEAALAKLKPGEITEPIAVLDEYAIFRLDRRGAELTESERKIAVETYLVSSKHAHNAVAKAVKEIPWTTTIGTTPEWLKRSDE